MSNLGVGSLLHAQNTVYQSLAWRLDVANKLSFSRTLSYKLGKQEVLDEDPNLEPDNTWPSSGQWSLRCS